jgi:hypothetical protein
MSVLGLRFVIDTHLIDNESVDMAALWRLHESRMIQLLRTDVMDTELSQAKDKEQRERLLALSAALPEQLGVLVLDHSRLDHAVLGCDEDAAQWDKVWNVLSPGRDRASADRRHVRDAMNVWTAMRYGANAFVTLDGSGKDKGILDRAQAVRAAFNDFALMTPAQALAFSDRMLTRHKVRSSRTDQTTD